MIHLYPLTQFKVREILADSGKHTAAQMLAYLKVRHLGEYDITLARKNAKEMAKEIKEDQKRYKR